MSTIDDGEAKGERVTLKRIAKLAGSVRIRRVGVHGMSVGFRARNRNGRMSVLGRPLHPGRARRPAGMLRIAVGGTSAGRYSAWPAVSATQFGHKRSPVTVRFAVGLA